MGDWSDYMDFNFYVRKIMGTIIMPINTGNNNRESRCYIESYMVEQKENKELYDRCMKEAGVADPFFAALALILIIIFIVMIIATIIDFIKNIF